MAVPSIVPCPPFAADSACRPSPYGQTKEQRNKGTNVPCFLLTSALWTAWFSVVRCSSSRFWVPGALWACRFSALAPLFLCSFVPLFLRLSEVLP